MTVARRQRRGHNLPPGSSRASGRWRWLAGILVVLACCNDSVALQELIAVPSVDSATAGTTQRLMQALADQGVAPEQISGIDAKGIPAVCGTDSRNVLWSNNGVPMRKNGLPPGTRSWEVIPCVIRYDGIEQCHLEVDANGVVNTVFFECPINLIPASGGTFQTLHDDGLGNDRIAGDGIYTSVSLRANTGFPMAEFYRHDTNSPAGLDFADIGTVKIVELNGETNEFLISPQVGLLHPSIPAVASLALSSNVIVTPHLIHIRSGEQRSSKYLRLIQSDIQPLTIEMYAVVADTFDFLMFFTTDHIERLPRTDSFNFIVGLHSSVQVNYTGTGQNPFNNSADLGSGGRLLGINFLDTNARGIYSANATHELVHQWAAFLNPGLGLSEDSAHYKHRSNIGSLVGGQLWTDSGTNTFIMNCEEGRNAAHRAPPLDRYFMGLIDSSAVPVSRAYSDALTGPLNLCGQVVSNIVTTVGVEEIVAALGSRVPGPGEAQRDFSIGFVAETRSRLFNPTELTFYEILAAYCTKPVSAEQPDPYLSQNWVPIGRFFGEETTWHSSVHSAVQPVFTSIVRSNLNIHISGKGFPDLEYLLQSSTNLLNWMPAGVVTAGADGSFQASDSPGPPNRFYRLVWSE